MDWLEREERDAEYWAQVDMDYRIGRLAALEGAPALGEDGNTYDYEAERRWLRGEV